MFAGHRPERSSIHKLLRFQKHLRQIVQPIHSVVLGTCIITLEVQAINGAKVMLGTEVFNTLF